MGDEDKGADLYELLLGKKADDLKNVRGLPDELRGKTPEEMELFVQVLDAHLRSLHQTDEGELRDKTDAEQTAFEYGLEIRKIALAKIDEHRAVVEVFRRKPRAVERVFDGVRNHEDPYGDVRRLPAGEARTLAMRRLDTDRVGTAHLADDQRTHIESLMRSDPWIARRILVTETEEYRSAWMKLVTRPHPQLDADEQRALAAWEEFRAASENVVSAGGYGIPVFIDPSIILTAQGSGNPFLEIAKQVQINTNIWRGVTSAGVSWTFQTEAAAAGDASPVLAQPTITVHMARGFIPYSIEVGEDYPSFASEMSGLLSAGYDELLVDKFTRGTGTGEPRGILTALSANTNVRVTVTTVGTVGAPDPYKAWQAVPQRFRRGASWLMSISANNAIRQIGTANVFHGYTVNLPQMWADQLMGKPVFESPYMPATTTSNTAPEGVAIAGDFSNFVIARHGGMSVELIPQLFQQVTAGTGPAVPTGQRGWFAYARIGSNSVNDLAFRMLVNS